MNKTRGLKPTMSLIALCEENNNQTFLMYQKYLL
jgi:hypothetical protein